ncbi:hypothetical protein [Streptomyces sp. NPDC004728]|uniref:hypothetical protein n=1 Tax=Streptomyces sp. NPDC004728 TaxID=3154289 RepID=UPI0033B0AEAB
MPAARSVAGCVPARTRCAEARHAALLISRVPVCTITETGARTYALSELMVRTPWRKTARRLQGGPT